MKAYTPFTLSLALGICLSFAQVNAQETSRLLPEETVAGEGIGLATATDGTSIVATTRFTRQAYVFERQGDTWISVATLKGNNVLANGNESKGFGQATKIEGNTLVIGVPESYAGTQKGVGMVQVFAKEGEEWKIQHVIRATEAAEKAHFGEVLSLHEGRLLVGAPDYKYEKGQAFLYHQNGTNWEGSQLKAPMAAYRATSQFGASVAIQGNIAVVGAPGIIERHTAIGGVSIYHPEEDGNWKLSQHLQDKKLENLGKSLALQGDLLAAGAYETVVMYQRQGEEWVEQTKLENPDTGEAMNFASTLSLSPDGQFLLVGSSGKAYLYSQVEGTWALLATETKNETNFATDNALGNDFFLLNSPYVGEETIDGAVYVYPLAPYLGGLIK